MAGSPRGASLESRWRWWRRTRAARGWSRWPRSSWAMRSSARALHISSDCGETWERATHTLDTVEDLAWTMRDGTPVLLIATRVGLFELALKPGATPLQVLVDPQRPGPGLLRRGRRVGCARRGQRRRCPAWSRPASISRARRAGGQLPPVRPARAGRARAGGAAGRAARLPLGGAGGGERRGSGQGVLEPRAAGLTRTRRTGGAPRQGLGWRELPVARLRGLHRAYAGSHRAGVLWQDASRPTPVAAPGCRTAACHSERPSASSSRCSPWPRRPRASRCWRGARAASFARPEGRRALRALLDARVHREGDAAAHLAPGAPARMSSRW